MENNFDNYRLLTAEIIYHMPDHPNLLQTYIWQNMDMAPNFPALHHFLNYWQQNLEGELHCVVVGDIGVITPKDLRYFSNGFTIH